MALKPWTSPPMPYKGRTYRVHLLIPDGWTLDRVSDVDFHWRPPGAHRDEGWLVLKIRVAGYHGYQQQTEYPAGRVVVIDGEAMVWRQASAKGPFAFLSYGRSDARRFRADRADHAALARSLRITA